MDGRLGRVDRAVWSSVLPRSSPVGSVSWLTFLAAYPLCHQLLEFPEVPIMSALSLQELEDTGFHRLLKRCLFSIADR